MQTPIVGEPREIGTLPCPANGCEALIPVMARLVLDKTADGVSIEAVVDHSEFELHLYGHGATIRIAREGDDNVIEADMGEDK